MTYSKALLTFVATMTVALRTLLANLKAARAFAFRERRIEAANRSLAKMAGKLTQPCNDFTYLP